VPQSVIMELISGLAWGLPVLSDCLWARQDDLKIHRVAMRCRHGFSFIGVDCEGDWGSGCNIVQPD